MESPQTKVVYVTYLTVKEIQETSMDVWASGVGKDAIFNRQVVGWDVLWVEQIGGLRFQERPEFNPGDRVKISYEKVS